MSLRELRASEADQWRASEAGWRRGFEVDRRRAFEADRRFGSSTKWVGWWVGDVELQWHQR